MKAYVAAALAAFFVSPAQAQALECASVADAYAILTDMYGESRIGAGLSGNGYILEMWANSETGSWTALAINSAGMACIVDQGEAFIVPDLIPAGDPA